MLTLLGSLLGFISSAFPDLLRLWQDHQDRKHELAILDRQMEQMRLGHTQRLEEIAVEADIAESKALYRHDSRPSGVKWVDGLRASVLRIPLKMTADSEERDRLAHRFLTGAGFLLRAVTIGQLGGQFAHRFPAQFEAVRTVQQSVEDGVRQGRLADVVVPVLGG